ncbi:MAG: SulP family inorganic anion transporter [Flavobacteriales bacterium]|nr:SulP family inorganic anion transporter [Flavobacteriales bacterium]
MTEFNTGDIPKNGWSGFVQNWRHDLIAAISVALVALPLGLGISIASGDSVPPMAGVISAIIGGLFTTFIRGSHVGINGPGAGLIGVSLAGIAGLADKGLNNGFQYYLAAIVLAGLIQAAMGFFKLGKYGDLLPTSVVKGVLAAIGIIIIASQIHIALGVDFKGTAFESLTAIPQMLNRLNWPITSIAFVSLAILYIHPFFINKLRILHYIPAPMLVLLATIPMVYAFNMPVNHVINVFGSENLVGSQNLVRVENILDSIDFSGGFSFLPNFGKINQIDFWGTVIGVFLVSTIETIPSAKAIDKLDPYKRTTDLNKDLVGTGVSTILAGFLGGFPVITVIVRSSLNINHGAKTKWSNFFHGIILLAIVFFLIEPIQKVPLAALAGILIFTGLKLASPKMFSDTFKMGYEQFIILAVTLFSTVKFNLQTGLVTGILITLLIHLVKSHIPLNLFFKYIRNPQYIINLEEKGIVLKVKGISNFTNITNLSEELNVIGLGNNVIVDFSQARLVDHTVLEFLKEWGDKNENQGGEMDIVGLDSHITTSQNPLSLHVQPPKGSLFLSKRQHGLKDLAGEINCTFNPEEGWSKSRFKKFMLFQSRPIEFSKNSILGKFKNNIEWEVCDLTFDEGAFLAKEVHHTTAILIKLNNRDIPVFEIEKEGWLHRILDLAKKEEIIFENTQFTEKFSVKGSNEKEVKRFFSDEIIDFISQYNEYHIEGNNSGLLILKSFRFASPMEVKGLIAFAQSLTDIIQRNYKPILLSKPTDQ